MGHEFLTIQCLASDISPNLRYNFRYAKKRERISY